MGACGRPVAGRIRHARDVCHQWQPEPCRTRPGRPTVPSRSRWCARPQRRVAPHTTLSIVAAGAAGVHVGLCVRGVSFHTFLTLRDDADG
jgi:hypothetical protein